MLKKIFSSISGGKKHERASFVQELQDTKNILNRVSPTFCIAKWKQVTLHLHNGQTHSCHHPVPHLIPLDELIKNPSALHNTQHKIEAREEMLAGIQTEECNYCWTVENGTENSFSDRVMKSNEAWARPFLKQIMNEPDEMKTVPSYLEISFSNKCNFKCSYCNPGSSSKWLDEISTHGSYDLSNGKYNDLSFFQPILEEENNPYITAFWEWFPTIYKNLKVLRITGGEPLLSKNTKRLIEFVKNNPSPHLEFSVNTNLGVPKNILEDFVQQLQELENNNSVKSSIVFTSVDGWGKQAEYIRFGMKFSHFWNNLNLILNSTKKTSVTVMCTLNIMSLPSLKELLENILILKRKTTYRNSARLHIDVSYVRYPQFMTIRILNRKLRDQLEECVRFMKNNEIKNHVPGFHPQETEKLERIFELTKQKLPSNEKKVLLKSFFQFVEEHDRRRKTNFSHTFPELIKEIYRNNDSREE